MKKRFLLCLVCLTQAAMASERDVDSLFEYLRIGRDIPLYEMPRPLRQRLEGIAEQVRVSREDGLIMERSSYTDLKAYVEDLLSDLDVGSGAVYLCPPVEIFAQGDRRMPDGRIRRDTVGRINVTGDCRWFGGGDNGQSGWLDIDRFWSCSGNVQYDYGQAYFEAGEKSVRVADTEYFSVYPQEESDNIVVYGQVSPSRCIRCCP
ncbi:hypothetical protein HCH_06452 [Hahella chejuensis KCTC 2396]|uniref:Uncharacterized protein n=1 Tax=Hahella chejuensis (strain KCTC 2396) TaxID=349521 RepID=Q2S8C8_HAHCH|nr:hypothetical protein [Hahella chejuensis]ABC33096.1 hypothetical protein HCH_06452 [Hahella chejuensis KCTC 2396]